MKKLPDYQKFLLAIAIVFVSYVLVNYFEQRHYINENFNSRNCDLAKEACTTVVGNEGQVTLGVKETADHLIQATATLKGLPAEHVSLDTLATNLPTCSLSVSLEPTSSVGRYQSAQFQLPECSVNVGIWTFMLRVQNGPDMLAVPYRFVVKGK